MNKSYCEIPLSVFCSLRPDFVEQNPQIALLLPDSLYIVRIQDNIIEVGYPGDNWNIK